MGAFVWAMQLAFRRSVSYGYLFRIWGEGATDFAVAAVVEGECSVTLSLPVYM